MLSSQGALKALLDPNKDFIFIMELYKLHITVQPEQNQQGVVCETKHKPCIFGIISSS